MRKSYVLILMLALAPSAFGVPFLQLDVSDGIYKDESVHNTTNPFTVYALVDSSKKNDFAIGTTSTYYLAVAITPQQSLADLGSFKIDGISYYPDNLTFGGPEGLPSHGIFNTWWLEIPFNALPGRSSSYDVQTNPGGPKDDPQGALHYQAFEFDISELGVGYELHIDLYTKKVDKKGNEVVDKFAPFSHDVQDGPVSTPDGGNTLILLGAGLCLLGASRAALLGLGLSPQLAARR
jgi:hypothetical protein